MATTINFCRLCGKFTENPKAEYCNKCLLGFEEADRQEWEEELIDEDDEDGKMLF